MGSETVGSILCGLGLLLTFHESWEPVNPACKALGPVFYCTSDDQVLQLSACLGSYRGTLGLANRVWRLVHWPMWSSDCVFKCEGLCVWMCLHVYVSARLLMKNDQMTRWAVINELSTEHFWPSGKQVPWRSWPVSGHRGRGAAAQRALCLCQDSPEDSRTGPAHLDNTSLLTALHLSVVT